MRRSMRYRHLCRAGEYDYSNAMPTAIHTARPCPQLHSQTADSAPVRAEDPTPSPGRCAPLPSVVVGAVGDVAGVAVPGRRLARLRTESAGRLTRLRTESAGRLTRLRTESAGRLTRLRTESAGAHRGSDRAPPRSESAPSESPWRRRIRVHVATLR
jgi:hypothetical protein